MTPVVVSSVPPPRADQRRPAAAVGPSSLVAVVHPVRAMKSWPHQIGAVILGHVRPELQGDVGNVLALDREDGTS